MERRSGFTLIELVIVLAVAAILIGISIVAFSDVQARMSAGQGLRTFQAMHARARAQAIEGGVTTALIVDSAGDSVVIRRNGEALETIRFREELGVDIEGSVSWFRLCLTPRGFADPDCSSTSSPVRLAFTQGSNSETVEVLPLGQLVN